jgi:hypothetical protein
MTEFDISLHTHTHTVELINVHTPPELCINFNFPISSFFVVGNTRKKKKKLVKHQKSDMAEKVNKNRWSLKIDAENCVYQE